MRRRDKHSMSDTSTNRSSSLLPTQAPGYIGPWGDLRLVDPEVGPQSAGAYCYQIAIYFPNPASWFCLIGPPGTELAPLDPDRLPHQRLSALRRWVAEVETSQGLRNHRAHGAAAALRWDARRQELSIYRDTFGRVPLVFTPGGQDLSFPEVSTRPDELRPWQPDMLLNPDDAHRDLLRHVAVGQDCCAREDFIPGLHRVFPG